MHRKSTDSNLNEMHKKVSYETNKVYVLIKLLNFNIKFISWGSHKFA